MKALVIDVLKTFAFLLGASILVTFAKWWEV